MILKQSWIDYFFDIADVVKERSKDPSTKVGAILVSDKRQVLGTGYNGFPIGIEDDIDRVPERYVKPLKLIMTSHAEANVIAFAAQNGVATSGACLFVTSQPCMSCAKLIIQAGIAKVYYRNDYKPAEPENEWDWRNSSDKVLELFNEAGVTWYCVDSNKKIN